MRRALLVAMTIVAGVAVACGSFGAADDTTPGPSNDGGPGADGGGDGGNVITCTEEEKKTPRHCGRCGRDCGGGKCVDGECRPYKIAENVASWYLAVDAKHVYWTSRISNELSGRGSGKVMRVAKLGGAPPEEVWTNADCFDLAPVGDTVFVTVVQGNTGSLHRVRLGTTTEDTLAGLAVEVTARDSKAYAVEVDSPNRILRMEASGAAGPVEEYGVKEDNIEGLATDDAYLYFTKHLEQGAILRRPFDGGAKSVQTIVSSAAFPRRVFVDDKYIYWTSDGAFGVWRASKLDGTGVTQIIEGDIGWGRAIASGERVYATLQKESKIVRVPRDGTTDPIVIEDGLDNPMGLAQDDVAIYFGEYGNAGAIWRMVK